MKILIFVSIIIVALATTAEDDKVDQGAINDLGLNFSETVYSGYLPVNDDGSAQFHYWLFHSNDRMPLTLWLNGGPGCSSAGGLFNENGPTFFTFGTTKIEPNPYKWTAVSNMMYLESPMGVGFSYGPQPLEVQNDKSTGQYNLKALINFFKRFPQYQNSEFYITGESYAGIYIPYLANEIIDYNNNPKNEFKINLKGVMIGNGCTDTSECTSNAYAYPFHKMKYMGEHNKISRSLYQQSMENIDNCYGQNNDQCQALVDQFYAEFKNDKNINWYNIYGPCPMEEFSVNGVHIKRSQELKSDPFDDDHNVENVIRPCSDNLGLFTLMRNPAFQEAFHIDATKTPAWMDCSDINYVKENLGSYFIYPKLIKNNIRIWKFSGDIDGQVPITGTLYWINKFQNQYNLRTLVEWRPWYITGDIDSRRQNAGNYWKLNGLTFVSVKAAGHMVPTVQRQAALTMFFSFLKDNDLPDS